MLTIGVLQTDNAHSFSLLPIMEILFRRYKMTVTLTQRKRGGGESRRSAWRGKGWRRTRRTRRRRRR